MEEGNTTFSTAGTSPNKSLADNFDKKKREKKGKPGRA
jgi:hypothetical protein